MRPALRHALVLALAASACGVGGAHEEPVSTVLVVLAVVLVAAKLGGEIAVRLGQPSVLGELLVGVALGYGHHAGLPVPDIAGDATVGMLAQLGVVVLLFQVGLESTVPQLLSVGGRATLIAIVGVIGPIVGGFVLGPMLLPGSHWTKALFMGAAMCATSVGITARVFKDLGATGSREARLIVGAAVIDDVLGLVVLSVVSGVARAADSGGALDWRIPAGSAGLAALFLTLSIVLGPRFSKVVFRASQRLRSPDVLLPLALALAFLFAYAAGLVQLAPIVGAYAAGLILERAHYQTLLDRGAAELEELVHPIAQFLVPIFFVLMGSRVKAWEFGNLQVWWIAGGLIVVGIVTKLACGLAAPRDANRLAVGVGMVPRGEVGLIFADAGQKLIVSGRPLLDGVDYSAIVLMVAVTTLVTPPLLGRVLRGSLARHPPAEPPTGHDVVG